MSTIWSFHWIAGLAVWRFANTTRIGFAAATFHILLIFWIIQLNTNFWIEIGSIGNSCFNFFPEILILHIPKLCSFVRCFQNCFCFLSMTFPSHVVTFGQQILVLHWNYSGDIKAKFDLGITFYYILFIPKVWAFQEAKYVVLAVETVYSAVLPLCPMVFLTKYWVHKHPLFSKRSGTHQWQSQGSPLTKW